MKNYVVNYRPSLSIWVDSEGVWEVDELLTETL